MLTGVFTRFDLVTHKPCTIQGLKEAIRGSVNYQQDGIIVAHKNGMYVPGSTPLMMLWKDASCSRFFLETDGDGNLPRHQVCEAILHHHLSKCLVYCAPQVNAVHIAIYAMLASGDNCDSYSSIGGLAQVHGLMQWRQGMPCSRGTIDLIMGKLLVSYKQWV